MRLVGCRCASGSAGLTMFYSYAGLSEWSTPGHWCRVPWNLDCYWLQHLLGIAECP